MPTRYDDPEDEDSDWSEDDSEDDPWSDDSDEGVTDFCPYCHSEIYDDAVRCPKCARYISAEDSPPRNLPLWLLIGTILAFISVWLTLGL